MIDYKNGYFKLRSMDIREGYLLAETMLIDGEELFAAFSSSRDKVIFTNKRILSINVQGWTATKSDCTSIPYKRIQLFSFSDTESADKDCELQIFLASVGQIRFELGGAYDVTHFQKKLSEYLL